MLLSRNGIQQMPPRDNTIAPRRQVVDTSLEQCRILLKNQWHAIRWLLYVSMISFLVHTLSRNVKLVMICPTVHSHMHAKRNPMQTTRTSNAPYPICLQTHALQLQRMAAHCLLTLHGHGKCRSGPFGHDPTR